ncbi:unnamed protein product, partial [marine sediment metagenome]
MANKLYKIGMSDGGGVFSSSSSSSVDSSSSSGGSSIIWELDLPDDDLKLQGKIILKEGEGVVVYNNNSNIYTIRDDS